MHVQAITHLFNFRYQKSSEDIRSACKTKIVAVRAKIEEREARIRRIREEYRITDAALVDILAQARQTRNAQVMYRYTSKGAGPRSHAGAGDIDDDEEVMIGAGVVNNLLTERDFIDGEREQVRKLELIVRNLRDLPDDEGVVQGHPLTNEELEFLGF